MIALNSVIVTHRGRPLHLAAFVKAFKDAAAQAEQYHHLHILDLGDYRVRIDEAANVTQHHLPSRDPLNKSKALNAGVRLSTSEWLTFADVDCLMPATFLRDLEESLTQRQEVRKWIYNVHYCDKHSSRLVALEGRDEVLGKPEKHPYTWDIVYDSLPVGNSHCSIRRSDYLNLGGYDEGFEGFGFEDQEFAHRCYKHLGPPELHPTCKFYHLWHETSGGWYDQHLTETNQHRLRCQKEQGYPKLPITEGWGVL